MPCCQCAGDRAACELGVELRIPDLAITCARNEPSERALPDPTVIIEILSPSNEAQTRENVWAYTTIPSVRHILLARSTDVAGELLTRLTVGSWPEQPSMLGNR